ncbi:MAG: sigma-54 dependent transcriptional regulator [Pseudomonadota bacterium]
MIRVLLADLSDTPAGVRVALDTLCGSIGWETTRIAAQADPALPVLLSLTAARTRLLELVADRPAARLLIVGPNDVSAALWALRHGASDYLVESDSDVAERLQAMLLASEKNRRPAPISISGSGKTVFRLARRVAPTDVSVLLQGPSGSGKEVLARFIHEHSVRRERPFVAINCAAMPDTMLESLLFGHERGAFTGADRRRDGKFLQASGGTLLLDEVTEMPLELQAKLLRAIQEQEIEPLGAGRAVSVDVRVIATTNRDPRTAIEEQRLREDLYYRLSVFPISVPALADRRDDVLPLADQVLRRFGTAEQIVAGFDRDAAIALEGYDWPGNVRELENVVRRALVLSDSRPITVEDLGLLRPAAGAPAKRDSAAAPDDTGLRDRLAQEELQIVVETLKRNGNHRAATARALGISERALRYKLARIRELGLGAEEKIA